ncbi:MAG: hypothetical protein U7126_12315 [Microcoleus sp.]
MTVVETQKNPVSEGFDASARNQVFVRIFGDSVETQKNPVSEGFDASARNLVFVRIFGDW